MRLIDADAVKYTQAYEPCGNGQYKAVNIVYETDIDGAPTIEPIQCGECIHHNMPTTDGWFCADGERLVK